MLIQKQIHEDTQINYKRSENVNATTHKKITLDWVNVGIYCIATERQRSSAIASSHGNR